MKIKVLKKKKNWFLSCERLHAFGQTTTRGGGGDGRSPMSPAFFTQMRTILDKNSRGWLRPSPFCMTFAEAAEADGGAGLGHRENLSIPNLVAEK